MHSTDLDTVIRLLRNGAKIFLRRQADGSLRMKLRHGPFHLFSTRYVLDEQGLQFIKLILKSNLKPSA